MKIELVDFDASQAAVIWQAGFRDKAPAWADFNAPYFEEYKPYETLEAFLAAGEWPDGPRKNGKCILADGVPVGMVSRHWQDERTRWMEVGIAIYDERYWSKGIGARALSELITQTFADFPEITHIGLTTWSGNKGMMRLAEKLGMTLEAQIRQVRFWQGVYYDSIKYGVLRDEWEQLKNKNF